MKTPKLFMIMLLLCCFACPGISYAQKITDPNIRFITDTTCNFQGLINKFKGKTIYINVWATWCHPCRVDLQTTKLVKPFEAYAAKNDVVVLYLCADKNGNTWRLFINANKLAGYHMLANKYVLEDLRTNYGEVQRRGKDGAVKKSLFLPRHMIVNGKGMVTDTMTYKEGSPELYARLNKIIGSN